MKCRSNRLDPRIIGGLRAVLMPNDVLTKEEAARFSLPLSITVGYAAEGLMDFQDLGTDPTNRLFRLIEINYGSPFPFRCCVVGNSAAEGDFSFFLPASQVAIFREEKPKARAFTKDEFEERFKVGDSVRYFVNDNSSDVLLTGQIVCYTYIPENPDSSLEIYIAGMRGPHKAEWLFDNIRYQPKDSDHFIPFGVEGV